MNRENAAQFLPLVQALAEGKIVQYRHVGGDWQDGSTFSFNDNPSKYRIKPPDAPKDARRVPLGPDDVPWGSAVRLKNNPSYELIVVAKSPSGLKAHIYTWDWAFAGDVLEILRPGSTTWEPCSKISPE